jgi:hypothetical protein
MTSGSRIQIDLELEGVVGQQNKPIRAVSSIA